MPDGASVWGSLRPELYGVAVTDEQNLRDSRDLAAQMDHSLADPRVRTKKQCWDAAWEIAAAAHLDACERNAYPKRP